MLQSFFEIGCDKTLFDGLNISRDKEFCEEYMGKFPVISISLKGVEGADYEGACEALRYIIGSEALRFSYLLESPNLTEEDKALYRSIIKLEDGRYKTGKSENSSNTRSDSGFGMLLPENRIN